MNNKIVKYVMYIIIVLQGITISLHTDSLGSLLVPFAAILFLFEKDKKNEGDNAR